jgi:drug/metabolite transporter (DMT)-like permease
MNRSSLTRGYTIALVSAVILSTTGIFIRYLTQTYHLPPLVLAFWRNVFVIVTLVVALGLFRPQLLRVGRQYLPYFMAYGLVLAMFNALWTLAVALNGAAVATVLVYSSAGFTALLGWWLLQERLDWAKLLAVVLWLGGCVMVSGALNPNAWQTNLIGILTGIFSGLGYAAYSLMGRSASQRGLNPWSTLLYTFGFASLFLLAANLLPENFLPGTAARPADLWWLGKAWAGWAILFLLAAGPTVIGYGLYNVSLTYLPSSVANLVLTLEPAFTAAIAYALLGEQLTGTQFVGSLVILTGVIFLRLYEGWRAGQIRLRRQRKVHPLYTP